MRFAKSIVAAVACLVAVCLTSQAGATNLSPLTTLLPQTTAQQSAPLLNKVHRRGYRHCHRRGRRCYLRRFRRCRVWNHRGRCVRWSWRVRRICRPRYRCHW